MIRLNHALIAFGIALLATTGAQAQNQYAKRPIKATRLGGTLVLDGVVSPDEWKNAAVAETFIDPVTGKTEMDQTKAHLAFDENFIYVSFYCLDSKPEEIVARETVRDSKYANRNNGPQNVEDNVEFTIDTFDTHRQEEISQFSVNAIGTRSASLGGGRGGKVEWKGDWDATVKRQPDGWSCEIRIPWGILNYPSKKGLVKMNVNFQRFQYRTKIMSVWSNTGVQGFLDQDGVWTDVEVPMKGFKRSLSLLPYTLPQVNNDGFSMRTGLDARYTLTPELTAVGSFNPDFATVEGAIESIQFSRQERFVPDRRPFFLEGGDYFGVQTNFNDIGALFYPRRVQTFDLGTKLYGKLSRKDSIGIMQTNDFGKESIIVSRYNHSFTETAQGGFFFSESDVPGAHNKTLVGDYHMRQGKYETEALVGTTQGTGAGGSMGVISVNQQDKNFIHEVQYHSISADFNIPTGFVPNTDYQGPLYLGVWFNRWRNGPLRNFQLVGVAYDWKHMNGDNFQKGYSTELEFETRGDMRIGFSAEQTRFEQELDQSLGFSIMSGASNRFQRIGIRGATGVQGERPYSFVGPSASIRIFNKLDLSYSGSFNNSNGQLQQHVLAASYEFTPYRAIGSRAVVFDGSINWYGFYRNSGQKGMETYFIIGDPNAKKFVRQLAVKVVIPFTIG